MLLAHIHEEPQVLWHVQLRPGTHPKAQAARATVLTRDARVPRGLR